MNRFLGILTLSLSLAAGAQTQPAPAGGPQPSSTSADSAPVDAAKQAKVEQLFAVMHIERMTDQLMGMVRQMILQTSSSAPGADSMTPEQKKMVAEFQGKAMQLALDNVGWKAMEPEYVKIYAQAYSMEELNALIAFYGSPAGQTMLAKTPELSQQTMKIVQARMVTLQPQLRQLTEQFVEQMKQSTPASKPSATPSK